MDRSNKRRLADFGSKKCGKKGKRQRRVEASSGCGNGPERPVKSQRRCCHIITKIMIKLS